MSALLNKICFFIWVAVIASLSELLFALTAPFKRFFRPANYVRCLTLRRVAENRLGLGLVEWADRLARELVSSSELHPEDWNSGNAIHHGNLLLGRIALHRGDIEGAVQHLIAAGQTRGSPQLDSFGPNMMLAQDLLGRGEKTAVLEYFRLCNNFWDPEFSQIERWSSQVHRGQQPSFGANLYY